MMLEMNINLLAFNRKSFLLIRITKIITKINISFINLSSIGYNSEISNGLTKTIRKISLKRLNIEPEKKLKTPIKIIMVVDISLLALLYSTTNKR